MELEPLQILLQQGEYKEYGYLNAFNMNTYPEFYD